MVHVTEPTGFLEFITVNPSVASHIAHLALFMDSWRGSVPETSEDSPTRDRLPDWLALFKQLSSTTSALELKILSLYFDKEETGVSNRGYGLEVEFIRALAKLKVTEEVVIEGWYALPWPAFLAKEMGVRIRDPSATNPTHAKRLRWQQGTESLKP